MPSVTVIMRTKNSADTLPQVLKALFSQNFKDFVLLVVDSTSTDETLSLLQPYPHQFMQVKAKEYFPGIVLNKAIEQVRTPYIVFLNSDSILLNPNSLQQLFNAIEDPNVVAAFGRQIPSPDADAWVRRDYEASFPPSPVAPPWMHLSLSYAAMKKTAWQKHPFYSDAWGSEDNEWGYWAKSQKLRIAYVPEAVVMHSHNYTLKQLYGRRFIEGEADAFIYRGFYTKTHMVVDIFKAICRDLIYHIQHHAWKDIFYIPARRIVYYWAYYKGHMWGENRLFTNNPDASIGQSTVLTRYEK